VRKEADKLASLATSKRSGGLQGLATVRKLDSLLEVAIALLLTARPWAGPGVALYRVKLKDPHSILAHPSRGGAAKPGASKGEVPDEVVRLPKVSRAALWPVRS
jgi:hypothetical protein